MLRDKKTRIILLTCMMALVLAGCGGKKKSKVNSSNFATSTDVTIGETTGSIAPSDNNQGNDMSGVTVVPQRDKDGFYVTDDFVETIGETVNVRVSPTTDSKIYMMLEPGKVMKRTGYNDEWTRVTIDRTSFYVFSEFVQITSKKQTTVGTDAGVDDEGKRLPKNKTIVIDACNQVNMNAATEPVGPGSEETKVGANTGFTGANMGTAEYAINLTYALALKAELESRGYVVTMTRESNDVNITNRQRAEIANTSGATAMVRIKMNYSTNTALSGVMATTMTHDNPYHPNLYADGQELATRMLQGVTIWTGATNHGVFQTDGMTAINWSNIPVAVIELGYLSNAEDEANLLDAEYQKKVISGLADGIDLYYN